MPSITPELLLYAYQNAIFPMADDADDSHLSWYKPEQRGVFILEKKNFRISKSLQKKMRNKDIYVEIDTNFHTVVEACANPEKFNGPTRKNTWINQVLKGVYEELFTMKYAHSIEVYMDKTLAGGLFGVAIQGCFFGESMFSVRTDASKIALYFLLAKLIEADFTILDAQFPTAHLTSLGLETLNAETYQTYLYAGLQKNVCFSQGTNYSCAELVQFFSHIS